MKHGRLTLTAATGLVGGSMLLGLPVANAAPGNAPDNRGQSKTVELSAQLTELNGSGASGSAHAVVRNQRIDSIDLSARGLTPNGPHAVHIHYGDDARNECPTMMDATEERADGTPRLSTTDGAPAYGPIVVSLTTSGDTTPGSALDLDRMPMASGGMLDYSRSDIEFTDVAGTGYGTEGGTGTGTAKQIADAVRDGEGVVVVHGVDYDDSGAYDFTSAGESDLTSAAPAEATDPALCGVLAPHEH